MNGEAPPLSDAPARLDVRITDAGVVRVCASGGWSITDHPPDSTQVIHLLGTGQAKGLELTVSDLAGWDTSLVACFTRLARLAAKRKLPVLRDPELPQGVGNLLDLALAVTPHIPPKKKNVPPLPERIGGWVLSMPAVALDVCSFVGEIALSCLRLVRGKAVYSGKDIWACLQDCGAGALPIVALTSLLIGLILAFVGVVQLRLFGAEIYVASLVAIGMTRIMGAIMTGIVLAGRTGAAYAAIIGSMQVNEEVDALTALGVPPADYLVLPRLIALAIMTPLLVLYADLMGMVGGFIVGSLVLGIDALEYLTFTQQSLKFSHLFVGVTHGFVFGLVVAIIGCYQGLRCSRSAEGVGAATTAAVVNIIVWIILVTAALTLVFNAVGI